MLAPFKKESDRQPTKFASLKLESRLRWSCGPGQSIAVPRRPPRSLRRLGGEPAASAEGGRVPQRAAVGAVARDQAVGAVLPFAFSEED